MVNARKVTSRFIKCVAFLLGCGFSLSSVVCAECGVADSVDLQIPATEETTTVAEAPDASEEETYVNGLDIDDFTYVLTDDEIVEADSDKHYDGGTYWVIEDDTQITIDTTKETLSAATEVTVIYSDGQTAYVRTADGTKGYVDLSELTEEEPEISATPTATPTETEDRAAVATATPVATATKEAKATATATPADTEIANAIATATVSPATTETACSKTVYSTDSVNVRSGPSTSYSKVKTVSAGTALTVVASTSNGWYRLDDGNYIKASLCSDTKPTATPIPTATPTTAAATTTTTTTTTKTGGNVSDYSDFASYAKSFVGVPYVYSGYSRSGLDCSGFVKYVFANWYGISLPHSANSISKLGTEVDASNISCGDVLCFDYNSDGVVDHVGIYIGGNTVVHASESAASVIATSYSYMTSVVTIRRFV